LDARIGEPGPSYCHLQDADKGKEDVDYPAHEEASSVTGKRQLKRYFRRGG